ncbi:hypothetical protein RND71_028668 [Anisodus tanguticus]|uniref:DUF7804 domain-containing protein n=1 Tax=Anisodus tanguticus TaxID=243964 RepID=A0AAE1RIV2_9SOLA|nr:hypothetical protein RND71_028668 [Anisodus tanguticus]
MASLRVNPSISLGTFDKIGTIHRRLTISMRKNDRHMMQRKPLGASLSLSNSLPSEKVVKIDDKENEVILSKNIDEWMKVSMVDIVKNLKQAPLLVHVYANEDERGRERQPEIKTERALVEQWPIMKSEWESGKTRTPDGLIFVDELGDEELEELNENSEEGLTKSWGVVVQGKGIEFGPACYLLKTSRVIAGRGMGLFCTHFCLVRVTNFRDSALKQFKGCWL